MGFNKPQPLIYPPRNLSEHIRRVGIIQFVCLIDCVAGFLSESG
jgi:hypothetical protein